LRSLERRSVISTEVWARSGPSASCRSTGRRDRLSAAWEVEALVRNSGVTYTTFTSVLEGFHNEVHGWVGGAMGSIMVSPADPLFWLHHAQISRNEHLKTVAAAPSVAPTLLSAARAQPRRNFASATPFGLTPTNMRKNSSVRPPPRTPRQPSDCSGGRERGNILHQRSAPSLPLKTGGSGPPSNRAFSGVRPRSALWFVDSRLLRWTKFGRPCPRTPSRRVRGAQRRRQPARAWALHAGRLRTSSPQFVQQCHDRRAQRPDPPRAPRPRPSP
jgi:tyrosinase-like protein